MTGWKRGLLGALCPAGRRARLMIFTYHQVLEHPDPLVPGAPTSERFERQLRWIKRYCNPLPLAEAVERLTEGSLPERAVSLSFDDGYANNLELAAPLLRKYDIPAIVFITVDAVERGVMWNDVLIEAVRNARDRIDASAIGLGTIGVDDVNRLSVASTLIRHVKYRHARERMALCESIYAGASREPLGRKMLSPQQVAQLARFGVDVGAHTVNHPILTMIEDSEARAEIEGSRAWLADKTGRPPVLFAYPNGKRGDDYDVRHSEIVRSLGFRAAVSTNWGCATRQSSLFELPRFKPWEDTDFGFFSRLCKVAAQSYLQAPA